MPLTVDVGYSSLTGPRPRNEDYCGAVTPVGSELEAKGILAAVADGIGGQEGGREAAEAVVRGLLGDYYATPATWSVPRALDAVLNPLNSWLISQGAARRERAGMATTLSALVLRGRRYYTAHIGDCRIYLLRAGRLSCLTSDHVWDHPELRHVLRRAVGLDAALVVDYGEGELEAGDVFLLVCDGVWSALPEARLAALLAERGEAQVAAAAITAAALAAGSGDNATALVLRVASLPDAARHDTEEAARRLPLPPRLDAGDRLDGLVVESVLHNSRASLLYRVRDTVSGERYVLKTLVPEADDDEQARALLAREEWLMQRAASSSLPQGIALPAGRRSALYLLMSWHEGETLQRLLDHGRHFTVSEAAALGLRLLKGLGALHRLEILHRDVKPANLHLGVDGKLRLLDLGVAASGLDEDAAGAPGTPSFMAPELLAGASCTVHSDLYAAGVTLYHLLTRKYPYGEIEPFQHPRFGDPVPPSRYRPDIPPWLEDVLLKAVAREPGARFSTAEEFLLALERGDRSRLRVPRRTPLASRAPARFWRALAVALVLINLFLIFLLVRR
ncbi:MAG: bifunctional protein-serine/threonine kinase/phosphatase [Pseudomonadota bacterium]